MNGAGVVKTTLSGDGGMFGSSGAGITCRPISTNIGLGPFCSGENISLGILDVGE